MNPNRSIQRIQRILRLIRLLNFVEKFRFLLSAIKHIKNNRKFYLIYPHYKVPPQFLAYDAYSAPDWNFYKISGENTALFLSEIVEKYRKNDNAKKNISL